MSGKNAKRGLKVTMDISHRNQPTVLGRIRNYRLTTTFMLLSALSIGILAGSVMTRNVSGKEQVDSSDARPLTIPSPVTLSNGFSKIAKDVGPAVVVIDTVSLPKQSAATPRRGGRNGMQRGPLQAQPPSGNDSNGDDQSGNMQDFFNRFFGGQGGGGGESQNTERQALGSGFIVDSRGYIITNNHVVDQADKIYVKLSNSPEGSLGIPAHVIGTDKETDIAVIKIDSKEPLPTVKMGNSDGAQVGDWVLAIGSPFELSQTVSAGIVSAKNRSITETGSGTTPVGQFQRFIQTDAAINPGNSGGPLVDMSGSVIGMNTAIYTESAGSEGVGFAMPSNTVINIYNMLIGPEHKVVRGSIGIQFSSGLPAAVGREYGFSNGVFISAVTPNQGAAKAGLQPEDVILSIDGRNIKDGDDLVNDISSRRVGSTVKIGYLRNGKQSVANVVIGDRVKTYAELNGETDNNNASTVVENDAGQSKLGITVTAVPPAILSKTGIKGGVIVSSVLPGSFADEIGLPKGSIITDINRKPVTDESSYRTIVSGLKTGDDVVFVLHNPQARSDMHSVVAGTLP